MNSNFLPNAGEPFRSCISSILKYNVVEYEVGRISKMQSRSRKLQEIKASTKVIRKTLFLTVNLQKGPV